MDSLITERSLAFQQPAMYLSRDYNTAEVSERPSVPGRWWKASERFTITLKEASSNTFIDPNTAFLEFGIIVDLPTDGLSPGLVATGIPSKTHVDITHCAPGVPLFGCPFFSNVTCSIPGVETQSFLESDSQAQYLVSSRLLCSSSVGGWESSDPAGRVAYKISGSPEMAGAKSVYERASCVRGAFFGDKPSTGSGYLDTDLFQAPSRTILYYRVPLSVFARVFNATSCMVPLSFLSSGASDSISFSFVCAPDASALNQSSTFFPATIVKPASYYLIDPTISYSRTIIQNPSMMAALESMYKGMASVNIAPGVSASVPMIMKFLDMKSSYTEVSKTSRFSLSVAANVASARGVMLRFVAPSGVAVKQGTPLVTVNAPPLTSKYLLDPKPVITNLVLKAGSLRVPLDPLSDVVTLLNGEIPGRPGEFASIDTIDFQSVREASRMYQKGKNLFSPFASTEDPYHDAMSMFWQLPVESTIGGLAQSFMRGYQVGQYTAGAFSAGTAIAYPGVPRGVTRVPYSGVLSANLFVIPFESISAVFNHREDAFACRGIDTRGLSSIEISGNLSVFDTTGILEGTNEPESVFPKNDTYVVYANLVFDEMISILSGRVDKNASYALIPGSSSTPSGAQ